MTTDQVARLTLELSGDRVKNRLGMIAPAALNPATLRSGRTPPLSDEATAWPKYNGAEESAERASPLKYEDDQTSYKDQDVGNPFQRVMVFGL